jgi:hypothetical protein
MDTKPDYTTMSEEEIAERLKPHVFANFDEVLAWFRSQNPDMENNHPEDLDWQAIKSAARRY